MEIINKLEQFLRVALIFLDSDNLKPTKEIIENYEKRLKQPMQVAIVGKIKASKSTLVNAILETDNVVQTGGMELTYNVSWLKYGTDNSGVKVIFKDGHVEIISNEQWTSWANADANKDEIKNNIAYMEIMFDNPILNDLNIIDTPGLLSGGIDAQNTIDFLSKNEHKPDAIVVLFADALHEAVANVIAEFQNRSNSGIDFSPINTLGIYSKIDTIWEPCNSTMTFDYPFKKASDTCNRVLNDPNTKSLFYNIYPLNSLLSIASYSINDKDIVLLKELIGSSIEKVENFLIMSSDFFEETDLPFAPCTYNRNHYCTKNGNNEPCKVDYHLSIDLENDTTCVRRYLFGKFHRYGIMLLCTYLKEHPQASLNEVKLYLREKSGFKQFLKVLKNHFGDRATLIKMQSAVANLLSDLDKENKRLVAAGHTDAAILVEQIQTNLNKELKNDNEFKLFEILASLYDGKLSDMASYLYENNFEQEDLEMDIKCLAGERGVAFSARLGFMEDLSVEELMNETDAKVKKWRSIAVEFREETSEPFYYEYAKIMYQSYYDLKNDIEKVSDKALEYNKLLRINII